MTPAQDTYDTAIPRRRRMSESDWQGNLNTQSQSSTFTGEPISARERGRSPSGRSDSALGDACLGGGKIYSKESDSGPSADTHGGPTNSTREDSPDTITLRGQAVPNPSPPAPGKLENAAGHFSGLTARGQGRSVRVVDQEEPIP